MAYHTTINAPTGQEVRMKMLSLVFSTFALLFGSAMPEIENNVFTGESLSPIEEVSIFPAAEPQKGGELDLIKKRIKGRFEEMSRVRVSATLSRSVNGEKLRVYNAEALMTKNGMIVEIKDGLEKTNQRLDELLSGNWGKVIKVAVGITDECLYYPITQNWVEGQYWLDFFDGNRVSIETLPSGHYRLLKKFTAPDGWQRTDTIVVSPDGLITEASTTEEGGTDGLRMEVAEKYSYEEGETR